MQRSATRLKSAALALSVLVGCSAEVAAAGQTSIGRQGVARRQAHEGHHHHHSSSSGSELRPIKWPVYSAGPATATGNIMIQARPDNPYGWDGTPSWELDHSRTFYFEPAAGLGNRLRAVASAVVLAREHGVGLKIIWREEEGCGDNCDPGFNSTWSNLFSEPKLRLADNFPGSNYSAKEEMLYLRAKDRDEFIPPLLPSQCLIHQPADPKDMQEIMKTGWMMADGKEVLCAKSDGWLTEEAERTAGFFYRLLRPSPPLAELIDAFKEKTKWEPGHMIGVHVRRKDLTIFNKANQFEKITNVLPLDKYIQLMKKHQTLAANSRTRFFLATDDKEAEAAIAAAFPPGKVLTYKKTAWSRRQAEGTQQALVDVMLLADCATLIGTYFSSFSATARLIGSPIFDEVVPDL